MFRSKVGDLLSIFCRFFLLAEAQPVKKSRPSPVEVAGLADPWASAKPMVRPLVKPFKGTKPKMLS